MPLDDYYTESRPEEYNNLPAPQMGVPVSQNLEVVRELTRNKVFTFKEGKDKDDPESIHDGDLPAEMRSFFWAYLSKDQILSKLNQTDINVLMERFEATLCVYMMSKSEEEFTLRTLQDINNLRAIVHFRLKRAIEGFERREIGTTTQQTLVGHVGSPQMSSPRPGFLARLGNRFFGSPAF